MSHDRFPREQTWKRRQIEANCHSRGGAFIAVLFNASILNNDDNDRLSPLRDKALKVITDSAVSVADVLGSVCYSSLERISTLRDGDISRNKGHVGCPPVKATSGWRQGKSFKTSTKTHLIAM